MKITEWIQKENNLYGHLPILHEYAQFESTGLAGRLQHGWNPTDGFGHWEGKLFAGTKFVWSQRVHEDLLLDSKTKVIGAPWAYLWELKKETLKHVRAEHEIICIPGHSSARANLEGSHRAYAQEVRAAEGESADITVSLFWRDYEFSQVRKAYEELGMRVVSLGNPSEYAGYDFLFEQMKLLLKFRRCISSRVISGLLYASILGLDCAIYGDPLIVKGEPDPVTTSLKRWPELFKNPSSKAINEFARSELGFSKLLTPDNLREAIEPRKIDLLEFGVVRLADTLARRLGHAN